jgi:hypothetical protein
MIDFAIGVLMYVVFPLVCGIIAASPFWYKRRIIIGNIIGSLIIAFIMIIMVLRTYGEYVGDREACRQSNYELPVCQQDDLSIIYNMFGLVGVSWLDVFGLFALSGFVEDKQRARNINPELF